MTDEPKRADKRMTPKFHELYGTLIKFLAYAIEDPYDFYKAQAMAHDLVNYLLEVEG